MLNLDVKFTGNEGLLLPWKLLKILVLFFCFLIVTPSLVQAYTAVGDNNYPPQIFINQEGTPDGYDIEVLRLIEAKNKITFKIKLMVWDEAKKEVMDGKADILIGVNKTPEREVYFDFSEPYLENRMVIFVLNDNFFIHGPEELKDRRVGVQRGDLAEEFLRKNYPAMNLYYFDNQLDALDALQKGKIDAVVGNYFTGYYWINKYGISGKIKVVGKPILTTNYCFAVKKGNKEVLAELNSGIKAIKLSGDLKKLQDEWFGENYFWQTLINRNNLFYYGKYVLGITLFLILTSWLVVIYLRYQIRKATLELRLTNEKLKKAYDETIRSFFKALEKKESKTAEHSLEVNRIAMVLGREMGLLKKELEVLNWGTLLHDIGKLGISEQILLKPGPLTSEEYEIIKKHPLIGYEMLKDIEYLRDAAKIVLYHQEKYDGSGYPFGLKGEEIPLSARICAVADALEAMIADRPYRRGRTLEEAIAEIVTNSGTQFDPAVVEVLLKIYKEKLFVKNTMG